VAGSLELGSLTALPLRAQPLRASGSSPLFLKHFPSLGLSPPLLFLPWRRRLGERRRHLSCLRPALCRRRAHPPGMPAPSLSFCCARRSTPNPNKNYLYSDLNPVTIYYLLTSISFVRIIGCTCVHPCPMLGPYISSFCCGSAYCVVRCGS
jgi:hypothetical protein